MGLDAFVRCRCFEDNKLKSGPVPHRDLYIDGEGYLCSKTLDYAHGQLGYEKFDEIYGDLEMEFHKWAEAPCEHEWGEACSERVGNVCGCMSFDGLVHNFGEKRFPLLANMLPEGNGGQYPVDLAPDTLKELDELIGLFKELPGWVLKKKKLKSPETPEIDDKPLYEDDDFGSEDYSELIEYEVVDEEWCAEGFPSGLFYRGDGESVKVDYIDGKVIFCCDGARMETSHFVESLLPEDRNYAERSEIQCLDYDANMCFPAFVREDHFDRYTRKYEFWVERVESVYSHSSERRTLEALRRLLVTSIELQHPIVWC